MDSATIFDLLFTLAYLIAGLVFLNSIANIIKRIQIENRAMTPMDVWYMIVPIYNYYYYYVLINKVYQSLKQEYESRHIKTKNIPRLFGFLAGHYGGMPWFGRKASWAPYNIRAVGF